MRPSDPLILVAPGTLARPGPIGRLARLLLGGACLFALAEIIIHAGIASSQPWSTMGSRLPLLFGPLCIFSYVVNIGWGRSWGNRPLLASLAGLALLALLAWLVSGSLDSRILGGPLNLWLGYFYAHLGLSFLLAAALATPGCEMRAIPELLGLLRGKASAEHHCPVGLLTRIDAWEQQQHSH